MWESGDREALAPLDLSSRECVLDVGCGTGELTRVLASETDGRVVGVDADADLLAVAREETGLPVVAGDATRLPCPDDAVDLVVCQALLVNLPDPAAALREFARVSSDSVAVVEPDNGDVGVDSSVEREVTLERRVRDAYMRGVDTDVSLGDRLPDLFASAGLSEVDTRRYYHEKRVEPPYGEHELRDAARKASGAGLADHETELRRALDGSENENGDAYDGLRREWREMGRDVVRAMQAGDYRRVELVPFDVVVGRV